MRLRGVWALLGGCALLGAPLLYFFTPSKPVVQSSTSVDALLKSLPNLRPFEVESAAYTALRQRIDWFPSPSSLLCEYAGSIKLGNAGAERIKSEFAWEQVPRDRIPNTIAEILPTGTLYRSKDFDKTFMNNPVMVGGSVIVVDEQFDKLYFAVQDIDHVGYQRTRK